ncbi:hypothetical protein H012_gp067 [Acanthamoeba polyphaga moumouvirus]|uniref:Uncharacterized protein n=1 Tax=Acanthamoeba polyphaga moumouvirus TaxID=1269028 RepID=L7RDL3_9VIRU|nr:hypothetical protein H012_gp067 [Acanthamoeba polyphaga moumouvirus]AGC02381.1 hypothetical protein Moumou_00866 [Acanthamoeba polyphaga moumouvirus]
MAGINFFTRHSNVFENDVTKNVAGLANNSSVRQKLASYNLNIANVAWEDTSRFKNSCFGSNISDLTLKVGDKRMPIIRGSNFTDVTVDLEKNKLPKLVVGNQNGTSLMKVTLEEYLRNFHEYCGIVIPNTNLYSDRDEHVLTSAQACVLPLRENKVEFAVDLYNYQSGSEPAVLVIIATAYGTSAQVVSGGNTVLYFNDEGTSRLFKAERLRDYRLSQGKSLDGPMDAEEKALNGIYIFQVPLKVSSPKRYNSYKSDGSYDTDYLYSYFVNDCKFDEESVMLSSMDKSFDSLSPTITIQYFGSQESCSLGNTRSVSSRGMDRAILSIGEEKGPYKGIKNSAGQAYTLVRDVDKPIRLTVQFYMCTDTSDVSDMHVKEISEQIRNIYNQGLNEGSLVVNTTTKPGLQSPKHFTSTRPTETTYQGKYLSDPDISLL